MLVIIISLFVVSLILYFVAVFLVPGLGICGLLSAACVLVGLGTTFAGYGLGWGLIATVVVLVSGLSLLYWVMHSKRIERLSLHATIDSTIANEELANIHVNDEGVALTRLALGGNARINNVECEVRSASGFIEEGSLIRVTKIHLNEITVEAV